VLSVVKRSCWRGATLYPIYLSGIEKILVDDEEEEEPYLLKCMFVQCPTCLVCTPVPYLPLLFQGVSASDLPTKSISLLPTKDPGTNLFDCCKMKLRS
jgi:hypothetical protein